MEKNTPDYCWIYHFNLGTSNCLCGWYPPRRRFNGKFTKRVAGWREELVLEGIKIDTAKYSVIEIKTDYEELNLVCNEASMECVDSYR